MRVDVEEPMSPMSPVSPECDPPSITEVSIQRVHSWTKVSYQSKFFI